MTIKTQLQVLEALAWGRDSRGPRPLPRDSLETCHSSALLGTRTAAFFFPAWTQMLLQLPLVGLHGHPRPPEDNLGGPRKATFNRTRASGVLPLVACHSEHTKPINCIFQKGELCALWPVSLPPGQRPLQPTCPHAKRPPGRTAGFQKVSLPGRLSSYRDRSLPCRPIGQISTHSSDSSSSPAPLQSHPDSPSRGRHPVLGLPQCLSGPTFHPALRAVPDCPLLRPTPGPGS